MKRSINRSEHSSFSAVQAGAAVSAESTANGAGDGAGDDLDRLLHRRQRRRRWARDRVTWGGIAESATAFAAGAATVLPAAANADYTGSGFIGGGQIGYNYQMNSFVLGAEVDAQYTGIRGSRNTVSLGNTNGGPATIVPGNIS